MSYKRNASTGSKQHAQTPLLTGIILAIAAAAIAITALELTDTTHIFHAQKPSYNSPTASPATKGIPEQDADPATSGTGIGQGTDTPSTDDPKHPTSPPPSTPLIEPNGNFVNTHTILSLKNNPQMESICNTTAGASCQISFKNGSTIVSLPAQTTDRGGATYWAWKPKDSSINLTPGTWDIVVTATLDGQKKTVTDATDLEVRP